jgi:hypothetical protein
VSIQLVFAGDEKNRQFFSSPAKTNSEMKNINIKRIFIAI